MTAAVEAVSVDYQPARVASGPQGGQFTSTGGSGAKSAKSGPPPGSMRYDRKRNRGTGYGMRGGDKRVRALQQALNRLGITDSAGRALAVDGKLGPKTTSSIKKLQQRLGFKADGIVSPAFLAQIRNLRAVPQPKKAGKAAAKQPARRAPAPPTRDTAAVVQWWDIDPIGPLDEATEALICALDQLAPNRTTEARLSGDAFNAAIKRDSNGRFAKMIDQIIGALQAHRAEGKDGDPLAGFNRTQLRNAAKSRGITLVRGESDDSIKAKLIADIDGADAPAAPAPGERGADKPREPRAARKAAPKPLQRSDIEVGTPVSWTNSDGGVSYGRVVGRTGSSVKITWENGRTEPVSFRDKTMMADLIFGARTGLTRKTAPDSEQRVRDAHAALVTRVGEWISIADLRDRLGDMPREEQDAALERLATSPGVTIIPWDNQNALDGRDRAAALRFGGQENHAIRIEGVGPASRTPAPVRFEDMTEADLEREAQERRARQAANQAAQIERNGGQTDWERAMRLHNEEDIQSGEAEYRRADSKLDTEQRKLKAKRSELGQVEARIAALEASGDAGSARHARFVDMRDFLREEVADLEMLVSSSRVRVEELRRGESAAVKSRRGALGGAAARLAGAGAKLSAPPVASGEVGSRLRSASSVAQARDYLDGLKLSRPQLAQLARDLHVASYANANKTRLRDDIVAQLVGSRITHDAILRSSGGYERRGSSKSRTPNE